MDEFGWCFCLHGCYYPQSQFARSNALLQKASRREDILRDLPDFFSKMRVDEERSGANRIRLIDDKRHAVVRLDYDGLPKRWLLTAFDDGPPTSGRRTGVPGNLAQAGGTPPPFSDQTSAPGRTLDESGSPVAGTGESSSSPAGADSSVADKPPGGPTYLGSGFGALEPLFREAMYLPDSERSDTLPDPAWISPDKLA